MLHVNSILFATDFSDRSAAAFPLACALARDYGAKLVIVHVYLPSVIAFGEMPPLPPAPLNEERNAVKRLDDLCPEDSRIPIERYFRRGDPAVAIVDLAKELGSDLIVMGTHGRTGMRRLLMGSVAEEVLRRASCPVLTVKSAMPELVDLVREAEAVEA